ncbi:MAG: penicillin-binding transpeptidase domain-containing protein [Candidatus Levyibacteriota bacterium]
MKKLKAGVAFPDYISQETYTGSKRHYGEGGGSSVRSLLLPLIAGIIIVFLFLKLFSLQILQGNYYKKLADNNRTKTIVIHAPRGIIFDRYGTPLVFNIPGFREVKGEKINLLTQEEALPFLAQKGSNLEIDSLRQYPYREAFSHVLGYTSQISPQELKQDQFLDYDGGDIIGKAGIEQRFEQMLKGIDGKKLVEVDSQGKEIRSLGESDPISGKDIVLAVDAGLQKATYNAMKGVKKGAAIVSSPKGEILSLVSNPSFDPNLFTLGEQYRPATDSAYQNISSILLDSLSQPLLNRAISGTYPPGSTFKLITAAAGLENRIIDENYIVSDNGTLKIGEFSFANWYFTQYGKTEGDVDVVKGIKRSNDIFFYKLAEKIGVNTISETAAKFSVGETLGLDLNGEAKGILPTTSWKEKEIGEQWYLGDTYHYGIGQGFLLTTPLQVNGWTQVIANEGILYEPHLLKNQKSKVKSQKFLSEKTVSLIRQGMIEACEPTGVAWPLFEFRVKNSKLRIDGKNFLAVPESTSSAHFGDYRKVSIACKTGTAQHGGDETLPHAWITLFAPAYNPQIVVTVLSESSGEGSNMAAPIAKKILEYYFSK